MGLREIIGASMGGKPVEWTTAANYLRDRYVKDRDETIRRDAAAKRDAYYEGKGDEHIIRLIEIAFQDALTRKLRTDLVAWAKWNNVLRRIAGELAMVYTEPAKRRIGGDETKYQEFLDLVNIDAAMRELDEKLVYHEDVWLQYRVRPDTKEPVLDVVSPASFWAVHDPNDRTRIVAIIVDQTPKGNTRGDTACFRVLTADETFMLDAECRFIQSTLKPWNLGRLPGVLASVRPASAKGRLLTEFPAADLVAAHETIWFQNVLLVKESKSANKQTYASGDVSAATMGQSADTESETVLPEGVTVQAIDRGMDLGQFRDNGVFIFEQAAANRGLPPAVLHQRDAASGAEIHLRRIPLRELRNKRIATMRRIERELHSLIAATNAQDLPEYKFDASAFGIDFGEVQQPLTEAEQDAVFEERRRLGLTSTIEEIRRRNPDIKSDAEAQTLLSANITRETNRVIEMRALMAASGAMGTDTPDVETAQDGTPKPTAPGADRPDLAAIAKEILSAAN